MQSPWFVRPQPRPSARLRLVCFPYAGVGASVYRPWASQLPAEVELCAVQPPAREARLREPAIADLSELVSRIAENIQPYLDLPVVFFGHSMGALVAFELARQLARTGAPLPRQLLLSGRRAPRLPDPDPNISVLPDADFIAEIQRRYGGIPAEVMQHPDLLALLLPALRADVQALETYSYATGEPLDCRILVFGGVQDPRATVAQLEGWRAETRGPFALRMFPGGHFFLQSARAQLLQTIAAALYQTAATPLLHRTAT